MCVLCSDGRFPLTMMLGSHIAVLAARAFADAVVAVSVVVCSS